MKVYLASDQEGKALKDALKDRLSQLDYDIEDLTVDGAENFLVSTELACQALTENEDTFAIVVDRYGVGGYMVANKHKGIIPANLSDERTAYMTKQHNNARMITLGSGIVGEDLAYTIATEFLKATYDGGRHQVRVDMINAMC